MDPLDTRTSLFFVAGLYTVCPAVAWAVLSGQHTRQVALWCGGGLLVAGSLVLFGLQSSIPDVYSVLLGGWVLTLSSLMRIHSLRIDLDCPWPLAPQIMGLGILVASTTWIHVILENPVMRAQVASGAQMLTFVHLAWLAHRLARREGSRSAQWIAWSYALVSFGYLMRMVELTLKPLADPGPVNATTSLVVMLLAVVTCVVGHFGYVGIALDRSRRLELALVERRSREEVRRQLETQIAQLDRQRGLGVFSASLAHELNQPLAAIYANVHTARRGIETGQLGPERISGLLEKVGNSATRASQIIERIRAFIKPSEVQMDVVNLVDVIENVRTLIEDEARRQRVALVIHNEFNEICVRGDAIQLSQVLLNLARNAIEAMSAVQRRELQIRSTRVGARVIVRVQDSGPGLGEVQLASVGQPFFTTKADGLGMGFSISRSIAEHHGGTLKLENVMSITAAPVVGGAVATLSLPLHSSHGAVS